MRGADGYLATYAAGPTAVLTLLADDRVNVGRLHLEGRRCGARIAELVAARSADERPFGTGAAGSLRHMPAAGSRAPCRSASHRSPATGPESSRGPATALKNRPWSRRRALKAGP